MLTLFRWASRIVVTLLILAGLAAGLVYFLASRSLPDYDATLALDGPIGEIEIVRDRHAIPHIFASADRDVFFGLGVVHAQDRLWQMMLLRRAAQGRLAEAFGEDLYGTDLFLRALDIYGVAGEALPHLSEPTITALQAYSDGVNQWLRQIGTEALGRGAPEFFLFSPEIAPWTPQDSVAVAKLMALRLSSHMQFEILRARASLLVSPERLEDLMPQAPGPGTMGLETAALAPPVDMAAHLPGARFGVPAEALPVWLPGAFDAGASNAWAAGPARTSRGGALLATDPHLGFTAPAIWMLARLEFGEGGVIGGTIPGLPAVLIGRNADLGWGLTTAYADDQDLYFERLVEGGYRGPDGPLPFEERRVRIEIDGAPPRDVILRRTRHGPVLPPEALGLAEITPIDHVISLAWTALEPADTTVEAGLQLMRARSVDEARQIAERYVAPAQNLILADRDTIALQMIGRVPARDPGHATQGRVPAVGWLAVNDWHGTLPYASNPAVQDPASGLIANTNNKLVARPFPDHVSHRWGDAVRIARLERLLSQREVHTVDSFIEAQRDIVSPAARLLLPLIGRELWYADAAAPEGSADAMRQAALVRLAEWNGEMSQHLPEPLIYAAWLRALQMRLIQDELGRLAPEFARPDPLFLERVFRDLGGASAWCDIRQTSRIEGCAEISRAALDEALLELSGRFGDRLEAWRWGDLHQALHKHEVLGDVPLLRMAVNLRQETPGGDSTLMRGALAGAGPNPYLSVHGSGLRAVYDFADPDSSVFIISTGQSGHFLSRHYDDLSEIWRRGGYVPMSLDRDLALGGAAGVTRIVPR